MALVKCPECGKEFSDLAEMCPNCGYAAKYLKYQEQRKHLTIVTADTFPDFAEQEWTKRCKWAEAREALDARQEQERTEQKTKFQNKMAELKAQIAKLESIIKDNPTKVKERTEALKNLGLFAGAQKKSLRQEIDQLNLEYKNAVSKLDNVKKAKDDFVSAHDRKENELFTKHREQKGRINEKYLTYTFCSSPTMPKGAYKAYSAKDKDEFVAKLRKLCIYKGLEECTKKSGQTNLRDFAALTGFELDLVMEEARSLANPSFKDFQLRNEEELVSLRQAAQTHTQAKQPAKSRIQPVSASSDSVKIVLPSDKKKDASVIGRGVAGAVIAGPAGAVVGALSAIDKNNKNKK